MPVSRTAAGIGFGLLAYLIWGFFPLYFRQLSAVPPMDVLSHRAVWACVFVGVLLTLRARWANVAAILRAPRQLAMLALAALLVGSNWLVFLWAVANQQVVASSLGYFLTPLVNVLLGLLVLKESLNRLEWLSVGLAVAAIGNEIATLGSLPWVSLFLAATLAPTGWCASRCRSMRCRACGWKRCACCRCAAFTCSSSRQTRLPFLGNLSGSPQPC